MTAPKLERRPLEGCRAEVMIAVDPDQASNTAAVLDPVSTTVTEPARFATTLDG